MDEKQILSLILDKITSMDERFNSIEKRLDSIDKRFDSIDAELKDIKTVQAQHTEQIQVIKEQVVRNSEIESTVKELVDFKEYMKKFFQN